VIGGVAVALAETVTTVYLTSTYKDIVVFSLLLAVMYLRPAGLLGRAVTQRV
jgi:branched-subunit amino acid ABC-type transport system permease component